MESNIKLSEFAFACYAFPIFQKDYGKAYKDFLTATKPSFNMGDKAHREALLTWLNRWGCRQFKKDKDSRVRISKNLREWSEKNGPLPSERKKLLDLSSNEVTSAAKVYDTLQNVRVPCSTGKKTVGHTGASKILFAMRKDLYPIWDNAMRKKYKGEGCSTYKDYMKYAQRELSSLKSQCGEHGIGLDELRCELGRKDDSLLKLLDEYHWVFSRGRKIALPSFEKLQKWC